MPWIPLSTRDPLLRHLRAPRALPSPGRPSKRRLQPWMSLSDDAIHNRRLGVPSVTGVTAATRWRSNSRLSPHLDRSSRRHQATLGRHPTTRTVLEGLAEIWRRQEVLRTPRPSALPIVRSTTESSVPWPQSLSASPNRLPLHTERRSQGHRYCQGGPPGSHLNRCRASSQLRTSPSPVPRSRHREIDRSGPTPPRRIQLMNRLRRALLELPPIGRTDRSGPRRERRPNRLAPSRRAQAPGSPPPGHPGLGSRPALQSVRGELRGCTRAPRSPSSQGPLPDRPVQRLRPCIMVARSEVRPPCCGRRDMQHGP